jgi:hypothetical protein
MKSDRTYFIRRAAEERSAATRATDRNAREAHLELARRYRQRTRAGGETQTNGTDAPGAL